MQNKPVALVTGANKGIALEIARGLTANGFTVLVGSRHFANGVTAAKSIGAQAHALQLDVTDQASIAAAADRIKSEFGRLDVLVNNAGISPGVNEHQGQHRVPRPHRCGPQQLFRRAQCPAGRAPRASGRTLRCAARSA